VSVHGANRLGGNSLLDILVFGRAAANHIIDYLKENRLHRPMDEASLESAITRFRRWDGSNMKDGESVSGLREELKTVMEDHCGVFRNDEVLGEGITKVEALVKRYDDVTINDHSGVFNTARVEALELENLMGCALATIHSAHARTESRGAHSRIDHTERDDIHWMRHSLYSLEGGLDYKPVRTKPMSVDSFPPKARTY
jgi:succinate dehydrogenase / fumarate reductase flavoprotein subunit